MHQSGNSTDYRKELRKSILLTASQEFLTKGIRMVKMDDLAKTLKISKRTLYEIFENKEALLLAMVQNDIDIFEHHMQEFAKRNGGHVISVILEFYRLQMKRLSEVCVAYYEDLRRYPAVLHYLEKVRERHQADSALFFKRGVEEGYFRDDLDYELISQLTSKMLDESLEEKMYRKYGLKSIFHNVIQIIIRGMCTTEGNLELDRKMQDA